MNDNIHSIRILSTQYWSPCLMSFTAEKPPALQFVAGQFVRLGTTLDDGSHLFRPFSIASAPDAEPLEFFASVIPDGDFSARLATVKPGDTMLIDSTHYGYLTLDHFAAPPPSRLWLLATGTGLAPFLSILRDERTWQRYQHIILVYSVREIADLAYQSLIDTWQQPTAITARAKLTYLPVITRQNTTHLHERIPALLNSGALEHAAEHTLDPETDHIMLCGNPAMIREARQVLIAKGLTMSRRGIGNIAVENYWAEKHP
ncbi:MAG: ferredoxin--NADP reductase [Pseudomonadales bacterium]|nr:ferredoxin--NADP reductase [Pseudomonadales bacterium]